MSNVIEKVSVRKKFTCRNQTTMEYPAHSPDPSSAIVVFPLLRQNPCGHQIKGDRKVGSCDKVAHRR
jgi:hypothetical protein